MHRHSLDEGACQKRARQRDDADQQREGDDLRRQYAGNAECRHLDDTDDDRNRGIGRDDRGAFQTGRHQQRQQDDAGAGRAADKHTIDDRTYRQAAIAELHLVMLQQPPQRYTQDQHAADDECRAGAGQLGIAPGAEHAGRHRCHQHNRDAPPRHIFQESRHAA